MDNRVFCSPDDCPINHSYSSTCPDKKHKSLINDYCTVRSKQKGFTDKTNTHLCRSKVDGTSFCQMSFREDFFQEMQFWWRYCLVREHCFLNNPDVTVLGRSTFVRLHDCCSNCVTSILPHAVTVGGMWSHLLCGCCPFSIDTIAFSSYGSWVDFSRGCNPSHWSVMLVSPFFKKC